MKRLSLLLYFSLFIHFGIEAARALSLPQTIVQKDGSCLTVFLRGDEHSHFYFTADNIPISTGDDGCFYYAYHKEDHVERSSLLAHNVSERSEEERMFISEYAAKATDYLSDEWTEKMAITGMRRQTNRNVSSRKKSLGESKPYIGDKKGLVILVNFADKKMVQADANSAFDNMFNAVGYNKNGAIGSVHDYFYDQSYGKFNLSFDVVGPVTLANGYAYYGENASKSGSDMRASEMIVEACRLANAEVNYKDYDWDNDDEVDQVYVIYAGYGENVTGASPDYIWPHKYNLSYSGNTLVLDGVRIDTYACSCELSGFYGSTINGIGTACHEFSHCLGLPDLYNTRYTGGFNMDSWDLMSSGSFCGPTGHGEVPAGYTAYERWFAGWLEPVELNTPCIITGMPSLGDDAVAYAIYNDNNRNEYFLLENRQSKRWFTYVDTYTDCHGLLITHVDYNEAAWRNNNVNNFPQHQRMAIIPADNSFGSELTWDGTTRYSVSKRQYQGDLFPGLKNITALTNSSHENTGGSLFNINTDGTYNMNKPLTNISEEDGLISFYFMGGYYVPTPTLKDATDITDHSFNANWNKVEEAETYTLELAMLQPQGQPENNIILCEEMKNFKKGYSDGYDDLSDNLDDYMDNKGWEGKTIFTSQYGAKIGTTSTKGYLISPTFNTGETDLTIRFEAKALTSGGAKIKFELLDINGKSIESYECRVYYQSNKFIINIEGIMNKDVRLRISSDDRFYLSNVYLYSGVYDEEDFNSGLGSEHFRSIPCYTVNDIEGTTYKISDLIGNIYKYRVRANMSGAQSGWSPYQEVNLKGESSVRNIYIDKDSMVYDVYSLNGTKVRSIIKSGIYIVRDKSGTSKILIR